MFISYLTSYSISYLPSNFHSFSNPSNQKMLHTKVVAYTNTNPVLSDSGAPLKFSFCMLKNTTQADFQLKISTPGIVAAIRSSGKKVMKLQCWCEWISKIPLHGWRAWKNWFLMLKTCLVPAIFWPFFLIWWIKKWPEPKKLLKQKIIFSCLSTTQRNFWIPFTPVLYFQNFFPELLMAAGIPGVEIFS